MEKRDLITFRPAQKSDEGFVYRSMLMGTYHGNRPAKGKSIDPKAPVDFFSSIDQDVFMKAYHIHLEKLFERPEVMIGIACLVSDPDVILGFSVFDPSVLHFVFVKPDWRRIGIATDLVPKSIKVVSGFTRVGDIIRKRKGLSFNPWS